MYYVSCCIIFRWINAIFTLGCLFLVAIDFPKAHSKSVEANFIKDCSNVDAITNYVSLSTHCWSAIKCALYSALSYIYNATSLLCVGIIYGSNLEGSLPAVSTESRMTNRNLHKDLSCCLEKEYAYLERVNMCIRIRSGEKSFDFANATCAAENAKLLSIPSQEVNTEILNHIEKTYNYSLQPRFFIGLKDLYKTGNFTWTNGDPLVYVNWGNNEPDKITLETCAMINVNTKKWHNIYCNRPSPLHYICQKHRF